MSVLARMVGLALPDVRRLLKELEEAGVFSRTETGTIYSRRMVRDHELRHKRAEGGKLSLENPRVPRPKTQDHEHQGHPEGYPSEHPSGSPLPPSLQGSPSSSSSSSSSTSEEKKRDKPASPAHAHHSSLTPESIQKLWNALPGVKNCRELGKTIQTRIRTRLKEHPDPSWWQALFEQVRTSDFLCGRTNGSRGPFRASLIWALGPENLDKILAGDYENSDPAIGKPAAGCQFRVLNSRFHGICGKPVVPGQEKYCQEHASRKPAAQAVEAHV